mgnify:CR=1 FL=1
MGCKYQMTQYLIREFTDNIGHIHKNIEKSRENEKLYVVNAENKE